MFLKILASIRTNNVQDAACLEKIQRLWREQEAAVAEAFAEGEPVYAVYHDYASDYKGDYSLSICRPTDEESYDFDTSEQVYQVFEADKDDPQAVLHVWQKIWQAEDAGELRRSYSLDFEKYEPDQTIAVFIARPES
ncbi:effector binding domain-containing protein [Streptococcus panodentis]|uniref:AraC family transcriptional regulator n=1 Tax=Streptococcus panodentis TaxID=1581472 RepID=A0ABS5AYH0_9STRE|nr:MULTISPECIES: GyrI-like domain-containing protein [Streptococcus]KXT83658.1 putative transcription regulator [Streptococcus sp. DD11]MBP2621627.1 AraC family transcriptional regulator [Streptococcus panodentis]